MTKVRFLAGVLVAFWWWAAGCTDEGRTARPIDTASTVAASASPVATTLLVEPGTTLTTKSARTSP